MNIYLVVEGKKSEDKVYPAWVGFINPTLEFTRRLDDVKSNSVFIFSGEGYPSYLDTIRGAARDMSLMKDGAGFSVFHRLVVAVDAEEMSASAKATEILECIHTVTGHADAFDCKVIVHDFCLEAWLLANDHLYNHRSPDRSKQFRAHYDIAILDPEGLTLPKDSRWRTRAQYAFDYLRACIPDRWPRQVYSKRNPGAVLHEKYFKRVKNRFLEKGHVQSISTLFDAFN